jgi:hypothetical protein
MKQMGYAFGTVFECDDDRQSYLLIYETSGGSFAHTGSSLSSKAYLNLFRFSLFRVPFQIHET